MCVERWREAEDREGTRVLCSRGRRAATHSARQSHAVFRAASERLPPSVCFMQQAYDMFIQCPAPVALFARRALAFSFRPPFMNIFVTFPACFTLPVVLVACHSSLHDVCPPPYFCPRFSRCRCRAPFVCMSARQRGRPRESLLTE